MEEANITATFSSAPGDRATLSKASRLTIAALYRHPLAHNLEWSDVVALFEKLGTVDQKSHNQTAFGIGGEHHRMVKPHKKDLTTEDVMAFRHMLSRAGWDPAMAEAVDSEEAVTAGPPDLLIVIDHHEARIFHLDIGSAELGDHVIKPYDPHHFLHHLSHKDQPREHGQRSPEDPSLYERIAASVSPAGRVVLIGHGQGHSNAAHHLTEYLHQHHAQTFQKVVCEVVADLSSLTAPQLLDLGRRALTPGLAPKSD